MFGARLKSALGGKLTLAFEVSDAALCHYASP